MIRTEVPLHGSGKETTSVLLAPVKQCFFLFCEPIAVAEPCIVNYLDSAAVFFGRLDRLKSLLEFPY